MENTIYIYQHLGLGDHIICNGLVRELIKKYTNTAFYLVVKPHNYDSVSFMFRDITTLQYILADDAQFIKFIKNNNICYTNILCIGHGYTCNSSVTWDEGFYKQHNVNFNLRWENFKFNRDILRENFLYELLNPNNEDFVLIHSSGSDGIDRISYDAVNSNFKKIYVTPHTSILFDYYKLIECAKEIHAVSSSFHLFVDSINSNNKLFYHNLKNARNPTHQHKIKREWVLV